jgi:4-carboxymuconolactone decarboxylase
MARIPYHDMTGLPPELMELIRGRPPLNLYRMLPHAVTIAPGFLAMGRAILTNSELDPQLRELVILRVGALSDARYEVFQHRRVAATVGLSPDKIEAACNPGSEGALNELEQLLMRFTDGVVREVKAPDELFDAVAERLSHRTLSELLLTIGFYMLVSRFLENTGVDIEEKLVH